MSIEESLAGTRGFIARAELGSRTEVRQGDALVELAALTGEIDLVYVDCVKEHYPRYLDILLPKRSERGVVVADNVLRKGLVAKTEVPPSELTKVEALRAFNFALVTNPRLRGVILPLGDGVGYAVRASIEPLVLERLVEKRRLAQRVRAVDTPALVDIERHLPVVAACRLPAAQRRSKRIESSTPGRATRHETFSHPRTAMERTFDRRLYE